MQLRSLLQWQPIPRRAGTSRRLVWLMLAARFLDEWWVGLLLILMPLIRDDLGLSYAQVSVLLASFGWAGWVADPATGLAADVYPRRPLIVASAAATAGVLLVLTGAGSFGVMLLVCVGYSIAVTPPATIADAVLVETHPEAPGRIMARQTLIDTLGALLAPLTASLLAVLGIAWPAAFGVGAGMWLIYAVLLWRTPFPPNHVPQAADPGEPAGGGLRAMWRNLQAVSRVPAVWRWLFFLTLGDFLSDVAFGFWPLLLADVVGLSEALIGLALTGYMVASTVGLALLEPALARFGEGRVLRTAVIGVGLCFVLLVANPQPALAVVLLVAYGFCVSAIWPLGRARLLSSANGYTATVSALGPVAGLPANLAPLAVGAVASLAGLQAGLLVLMIAPPLMLVLMRQPAVPAAE